jgi:hypothetical protein
MKKLLILAAVALFSFSVAWAQDGGSISGTIQAEMNGTLLPLPGAHVFAFAANGDHPSADAVTDTFGHYLMNVPFGEYHVKAEKWNFNPEWFDNVQHRSEATIIHVTPDQSPDNIDFILAHDGPPPPPDDEGSIDGRITEAGSDHGLAWALVVANRIGDEPLEFRTHSIWNGNYAFFHLPNGSYLVRAEKQGFEPGQYPETLSVVDNAFHDINIALVHGDPPPPPDPGSISGIVIDGVTDLPIEGAIISAFGGNHHFPRVAHSGADGGYIIDSLPPGTYHLMALKWGYLPNEYPENIVIDGNEVTGIDFTMVPFEETGLSGVVTDEITGLPIARASVFAHDTENQWRHFMGMTGDDGAYFIHTPDGEYEVEAVAMGYWREEYPENVVVEEGNVVESVNFALGPIDFGSIAGIVTDSAGTPIPMAFVQARRMGGNFMRHARTDSTGAYLLTDIVPGSFRVSAFHRDFGPGSYPDSVVVADGQDVTGIDIVLGPGEAHETGLISGLVTDDSTDAPIDHAMVLAIGRVERFGHHHWFFRRAFSDSTGHYALENLPIVPLKIFAASRGYLGEFYDNVRRMSEATPVTPNADNINFSLSPRNRGFRSIVGRINMPAGYETEGLILYALQDGQISDIMLADPDGYYSLDALESGIYELSVSTVYGDANYDEPVDVMDSDAHADIQFSVTSVGDDQQLPKETSLAQNYPNPFNATTLISFELAQPGNVELNVYNIVGQKVATLIDGKFEAGSFSITWDGRDQSGNVVTSGMYYYRLEANGQTETMKMTLLK